MAELGPWRWTRPRPGGTLPRVLLVVLAVLTAGAAAAPAASAHARLAGSSPAANALVAHAPARVVFRFDEPVEGRFGALQVYDRRGARVPVTHVGHLGSDPATFAAALPADLADGEYAATYRVVSADGHPVAGGVVFSVGAVAGRGAPSLSALVDHAGAGPVTRGGFALVRAVDDLSLAVGIGLLAFLLLCWRPALAEVSGAGRDWQLASEAVARGAWRLLRWAMAAGAVCAALGLCFEGALAGGTSLWGALHPAVLGDTLGTRFGTVWGAKLVLWSLFGLSLLPLAPQGAFVLRPATLGADGQALGGPSRSRMLALALPAAGLALAPALAGHASTQGDPVVLVPAVVVHVVAMSVWIGGLLALALLVPQATRALRAGADRTRLLVAVLRRFSPLALGGVLALELTGTIQSIVYLDAFGDLVGDAFGRAILAKVLLVLALMVLGGLNRRLVMPRLAVQARAAGGPGAAGALLRRLVAVELGLLAAVLAATGLLAGYGPPSSAAGDAGAGRAVQAATATPPADTAVTVRRPVGPLAATAILRPARIGANVVRLRLRTGPGGRPFTGAKELTAQASLPAQGIGPLAVTFRRTAPGVYQSQGLQLVPDGAWQVVLAVRVSDFDEYATRFTMRVAP